MDENDISSEINAWTEEVDSNYQNKDKQLFLRYSSIFDKDDSKQKKGCETFY